MVPGLTSSLRALLFIGTVAIGACADARQGEIIATCPDDRSGVALPQRFHPKYARIEFGLPADSFTVKDALRESGPGEVLASQAGLLVAYGVGDGPSPARPVLAGEVVVSCTEVIGGLEASIRVLYSERTTVPGHYVTAVWPLPSGQRLTLMASHSDAERQADLLRIVRSVRFLDGPVSTH